MRYDVNFWGPVSTAISSIVTTLALIYTMYSNFKSTRIKLKVTEKVINKDGRGSAGFIKATIKNSSRIVIEVAKVSINGMLTDTSTLSFGERLVDFTLQPGEEVVVKLDVANNFDHNIYGEDDLKNWRIVAETKLGMKFHSKYEKKYTPIEIQKRIDEVKKELRLGE